MRGRSKPLGDNAGACNVFVSGHRRYAVVILFFAEATRQGGEVISHTMLNCKVSFFSQD